MYIDMPDIKTLIEKKKKSDLMQLNMGIKSQGSGMKN